MPTRTVTLMLCVSILMLRTVLAQAQEANLGTVRFPTSGSPPAQAHFLRGVAALHSFWYPIALDEFRAATRVKPACIIGY
jgi:hypothetical protein